MLGSEASAMDRDAGAHMVSNNKRPRTLVRGLGSFMPRQLYLTKGVNGPAPTHLNVAFAMIMSMSPPNVLLLVGLTRSLCSLSLSSMCRYSRPRIRSEYQMRVTNQSKPAPAYQ